MVSTNESNSRSTTEAIDLIRLREPNVAWELLLHLLPKLHDNARNNSKPRWREWDALPDENSNDTYRRMIEGTVSRILTDVGTSGARWQGIIACLPELYRRGFRDEFEAIVRTLSSVDLKQIPEIDAAFIWNALRQEIGQHKSFPDAAWSITTDALAKLEALLVAFEPKNAFLRFEYLFSDSPDLAEGLKRDLKAHEAAVRISRQHAARLLVSQYNLDDVLEFTNRVQRPIYLGFEIGQLAFEVDEDELIANCLEAQNGVFD